MATYCCTHVTCRPRGAEKLNTLPRQPLCLIISRKRCSRYQVPYRSHSAALRNRWASMPMRVPEVLSSTVMPPPLFSSLTLELDHPTCDDLIGATSSVLP